MNRKIIKRIWIVLVSVISLALVAYAALLWYLSPKIPTPKSDVPIEYKIGWWAYQEGVKLNTFSTKVVFDGLNAFNGTSVVEYNLGGELSYQNTWRPYIKSVHISERWEKYSGSHERTATIVVTPIVDVDKDETYAGETIEFEITVQDFLEAGGWGVNTYKVSSLGNDSKIELIQRK